MLTNSSASKAGLKVGDIIVRVNDEELSNNLGLNEVAKLITGPVGSTVKITVRKKFLKKETTYSIFRKKDTGVVMMY